MKKITDNQASVSNATEETLLRDSSMLATENTQELKVSLENVAVIGLGYVGLPLALLADKKGHKVIGIDTNTSLVKDIQKHDAPTFINEKEREDFVEHEISADTRFHAVRDADVLIICVPTPVHDDHSPDLRPLIEAAQSVAPMTKPGALVLIESTVSPGVTENIVLPIFEKNKELVREETLFFAHCPERINPGDPIWDLSTIPRVVGGIGPKSLDKAVAFYSQLLEGTIQPMKSLKEAEAVKMVENSFRDINIAFVNELAMSFQKLGIDITDVIEGASTKPFGFMPHFPGIGVGGHCIPVDPYYLIEEAKKNGFNHRFLKAARKVNNNMPKFTAQLLKRTMSHQGIKLKRSHIALLGLAYKKNIPDTRESPALKIKQELEKLGAVVHTYDPHVPHLSTESSLEDALNKSTAVVVATDHQAFTKLTPELLLQHRVPVIIDGRNCLDKDEFIAGGVTYVGIGR